MRRVILGTYVYQLIYQLPQLLVLPVLAKLLPQTELVALAKYLIVINLINMIADWGYSSLGAQKIFKHFDDKKKLHEVFQSGERVRFILWAALWGSSVLILFAMQEKNSIDDIFLPSMILLLGTLSSGLFPNWLIVGTRIYGYVIPFLFFIRLLSISLLVYMVQTTQDVVQSLIMYFSFLTFSSIFLRLRVIKQLNLLPCSNLNIDRTEFNSGFLFMLGGVFSYAYLSTGVFFVDRFGETANAASFVIAERIIAIARAVYAPFIQYLFVNIGREGNNSKKISKEFLLVLFIGSSLVWFVGALLINYLFNDRAAGEYFNILMMGFVFLGLSHHYITLNILGRGFILKWLMIMFAACVVYLTLLGLIAHGEYLEAGRAAVMAIVIAEISVFVFGIVINWRKK